MYQQSSINTETKNNNSSPPVNFTPLYANEYTLHRLSVYNPEKYSYKHQINYSKIITNIFISLFLLVGSYFSFLLPQIPNYNFIKELYNNTPKVRTEVQNLGELIEAFYNFYIQDKSKQKILLYNRQNQNYSFNLTSRSNQYSIQLSSVEKPYIQLTQEDHLEDSSNYLRLLKEKTNAIIDKSQLAKTQLGNYQSIIDRKSQTRDKELQQIINQINDNNLNAKKFVSESEKMSNYYYKVFDTMLALINQMYLLQTTTETTQLNLTQLSSQLQEFEYVSNQKYTDFKTIPKNELPENIDNLHNSILEFVKLFVDFSKTYEDFIAQKHSPEAFLVDLNNFLAKLDNNITKLSIYEKDFWQNNRYLRNYKQYTNTYQDIQNELEKQIRKNKLPMLEDISVFFE
ncbi:MAG: hypothetical protein KatS3mg091_832 [Patescibacteria group bacterium]|nr:MAG: hypothetical protein KatS3mg091_832 [Patescibacteria group bacterium]